MMDEQPTNMQELKLFKLLHNDDAMSDDNAIWCFFRDNWEQDKLDVKLIPL